jgi:hypothetical protein
MARRRHDDSDWEAFNNWPSPVFRRRARLVAAAVTLLGLTAFLLGDFLMRLAKP